MANEQHYSRRISSEEAKKKYIFVLKDSLSFFPPRGKPFTLTEPGHEKERSVVVESYRCTCRGPELPHDHYFIRWDDLRRGDKITITKDNKSAERFSLALKR